MTVDLAGASIAGRALPPLALGAPGVYFVPEVPTRRLSTEPMDVVAFAGVAPRGPAWERVHDATLVDSGITRARSVAVAVDSWDDYLERFGGVEGGGLLPHAVATYFAQGGRRAYIVRIVANQLDRSGSEPQPFGCAMLRLDATVTTGDGSPVRLRARNEGSWGNQLTATVSFSTRPIGAHPVTSRTLRLDPGATVAAGTTLRLRTGTAAPVLATVQAQWFQGRDAAPGHDAVVQLDRPFVMDDTTRVEVAEAGITVVDRDPSHRREDHFTGLGLDPGHPRYLGTVLRDEARLVDLDELVGGLVATDPWLPPASSIVEADGVDRAALVTPEDFFGRLLDGDDSGVNGLDALLGAPEVATVVVPDLYAPFPPSLVPHPTVVDDPAEFRPCRHRPDAAATAVAPVALSGLRLDPGDPAELDRIVGLQQRLVATAERLQIVALLDVPPGLRHSRILHWRTRFDSSFAAAYHPWLRAPGTDPTGPLEIVAPSAVAAGILARCERRDGISRGPANEAAAGIVAVTVPIDDDVAGELHHLGIDTFRLQTDGVRLISARTLSTDSTWRQLSVRRLLLLIERAVRRQLQWVVFEPNDGGLRAGLSLQLDGLLSGLFEQGAFAGDTPASSWFVHVATGPLVAAEADRGQVLVEVGVAPSEPTEYLVLRVALDAEGAIEADLRVGAAGLPHG
jgi:hypothetical protein